MENRFFFTLCSDRFSDEILLETSGDLPAGELLADILKVLNWPAEVDGKPVKYLLRSEDREIQLSESLVSAGVGNFERVWIIPNEKEGGMSGEVDKSVSGLSLPSPSAPQPFWALIPVERPSLIHPDGYMIILDEPPVLIGRRGGERPVQVDLSEFEKDKMISSRCHAEILLEKGEYCLKAFNTRNGTFIGREELKPEETRLLKNNDILQFGAGGVRFVFRLPQ